MPSIHNERINSMRKLNVAFIYPNQETSFRIPLAGSILTACIRKAGHNVRVFDTTFIGGEFKTDIQFSEDKGTVLASGMQKHIGKFDNRPLDEITKEFVNKFPPDLIVISIIERNYLTSSAVLESFKKWVDVPALAGGILPTIAAQVSIDIPEVDMICVGEGEEPLVDVCNALAANKSLTEISNLWIKNGNNNQIIKNPIRPLAELDTIPEQDWDLFDERHLFRPFRGKVRRNGTFEFSRGCMKKCAFCVAPFLKAVQTEGGGARYWRTKDPIAVVDEIERKLHQYDLNFIHFGDTDFLSGLKLDVIERFCDEYRRRINLPWIMQTSAESMNEKNMPMLARSGLANISVGVESGSTELRRTVLKKYVKKERIQRSFDLGRSLGIRMTANFMFGVPGETEETIRESFEFNRELNPPAIAAFFFTPFLGTELYDISLEKGYIEGFNPHQNLHKESPLDMPHLPKERISELVSLFIEDFSTFQNDLEYRDDDISSKLESTIAPTNELKE